MKIIKVDEHNAEEAGRIHSESWRESHRSFCYEAFVEKHSLSAQADYIRREIADGKQVYMLVDESPVGIVSVHGGLIENLYVLPSEQRKGYGTKLLRFAIQQCAGTPSLWILDNNEGAYRLYTRHGFKETGGKKRLNDQLSEIELVRCGKD